MRTILFAAASMMVLLTCVSVRAAPVELRLAAEGKALQAVVVGAGASEGTRRAAEDLAAYLRRISGAEFEVRSGDGERRLAGQVDGRGNVKFCVGNSDLLELTVTGGLIAHYRDRGNVKFTLHAAAEATLEPVARDASAPPDGKEHTVALRTRYGGLHTLEWSDGHDMTRVIWPKDLLFTIRSTLDDPMRLQGRWSLYFYVPRGTVKVAGFTTATAGKLLDREGEEVLSFDDMEQADYFSVAVPDGRDGTLWKFENCLGSRMLMTVPSYLAPSAKDLLLPREVVDAETGRPKQETPDHAKE